MLFFLWKTTFNIVKSPRHPFPIPDSSGMGLTKCESLIILAKLKFINFMNEIAS